MAGGRADDGMIGDGIAVAASIADFASPSRLLVSESFREAMADAAPGREAALFPAGTFNDPGLRTHELYSPDVRAAATRRGRLVALTAGMVIAILAAGLAVRISAVGHRKFVDGLVEQARLAAVHGQGVFRELVEKISWPKRN
jgi:hypothetical protein